MVQFKTEWNGACQMIAPVYEAELGIIEVPAILFFRSGRVVDHAVGLTSKNILISKIENALIPNQN